MCLQNSYSDYSIYGYGAEQLWDYCSPPNFGKQKTYTGEDCKGNCDEKTWTGYSYCYTNDSWDYCSVPKPYPEELGHNKCDDVKGHSTFG